MLLYFLVSCQNFSADYITYKLLGLLFIGIYVLAAYRHIKYTLLMNAFEDEKNY